MGIEITEKTESITQHKEFLYLDSTDIAYIMQVGVSVDSLSCILYFFLAFLVVFSSILCLKSIFSVSKTHKHVWLIWQSTHKIKSTHNTGRAHKDMQRYIYLMELS